MQTLGNLVAAFFALYLGLGDLQASPAECYGEVGINKDMMDGATLSGVAIEELERKIKTNPGDVHLRVKAAGYYLYGEKLSEDNSKTFSDHMLWLLDKCPASYSIGNFATYLDSYRMSEANAKARVLWLEKLKIQPVNIRIIENAVKFFMLDDIGLAEKYLDAGLEIEPDNERLLRYQGMLAK